MRRSLSDVVIAETGGGESHSDLPLPLQMFYPRQYHVTDPTNVLGGLFTSEIRQTQTMRSGHDAPISLLLLHRTWSVSLPSVPHRQAATYAEDADQTTGDLTYEGLDVG